MRVVKGGLLNVSLVTCVKCEGGCVKCEGGCVKCEGGCVKCEVREGRGVQLVKAGRFKSEVCEGRVCEGRVCEV